MSSAAETEPPALIAVHVHGDEGVHLSLPHTEVSLCGRQRRPRRETANFRRRGCDACLAVGTAAGYDLLRDGEHAWTNLPRLTGARVPTQRSR